MPRPALDARGPSSGESGALPDAGAPGRSKSAMRCIRSTAALLEVAMIMATIALTRPSAAKIDRGRAFPRYLAKPGRSGSRLEDQPSC
jgi:hypothetical protein